MTIENLNGLRSLFLSRRFVDDAHEVGLLHDQELLTVDLDLGARPFAEQHAVAGLDVDGDQLAGLVAATRSNGEDFTLRRLLLGGVRDDDAACRLFLKSEMDRGDPINREGVRTMATIKIALILAIPVAALLVPFPRSSAHEQVGACSLNVTNRCQIKSVIVAQADCRDLCTQHLMECRAVRGPNDRGCQSEYAVCISSCR
jgi:hypothetical protein